MNPILVVEDDPDIAESVRDVLEDEGYQVFTASNGKEGLERLGEIERPCLILLDLMMPVMSGGEFLAALKDSAVADSVVIMSAWPHEAEHLADQARAFVKKPISLEALLDVAQRYCGVEQRRP